MSTGNGSVSDQHGMNTAFKVLGLWYRYDRDWRGGGPRITEIGSSPAPHHPPRRRAVTSNPSPDSMRWTPEDAENEISEWRKLLGK